jgi:hypothetical protein
MTMPDAPPDPKGFSLRRWSQRKHAATRGEEPDRAAVADARGAPPSGKADDADARALSAVASVPDLSARRATSSAATADANPSAQRERLPLPPLVTLTSDSDYTPFMQPGVDETVKRGALRKLFSDPRFNVMDGLDVYIDDYSKPDPIDPAIVRTLVQARYIFNPPATRVNAHGHVEDVPDEPTAAEPDANDVPAAPEVLGLERGRDGDAAVQPAAAADVAESASQPSTDPPMPTAPDGDRR